MYLDREQIVCFPLCCDLLVWFIPLPTLFLFFCCVIFTAFSLWVKNSYPSYFFSIKIHSTSITPPCTLHQTCISHFQLLLNSVASWLHLYLTCYFSFLFLNINPEIALIIVFFYSFRGKKKCISPGLSLYNSS